MVVSKKPQRRAEIIAKLRKNVEQGIPVIGAGAGIGISAKFEEAGGADLIVTYDSGRFRMHGRPSISGLLSFGDANGIVLELAAEILPLVEHTPVLAGVFAHDSFRFMDKYLQQLKELGFAGVQNFPAFGGFEGNMRRELEEVGYGVYNEVALVKLAHEMDMLTTPYVFNEAECGQMVKAGADIIVVHCGCTAGGATGLKTDVAYGLDSAIPYLERLAAQALELNPDVLVLCHGGPLAEPRDVEYVLARTKNIHGFYGASSMERLPVERAIKAQVEAFKDLKLNK